MALCDQEIDPSVLSHSILADLHAPPRPVAGDGIVPKLSSHWEGVASELLVHGHHICLNHPEVINEVKSAFSKEHSGIQLCALCLRPRLANLQLIGKRNDTQQR